MDHLGVREFATSPAFLGIHELVDAGDRRSTCALDGGALTLRLVSCAARTVCAAVLRVQVGTGAGELPCRGLPSLAQVRGASRRARGAPQRTE